VTECQIEQTSNGCYKVLLPPVNGAKGWSADLLLRSDAHHDNSHSDHRLELTHLNEAVERQAGILDIGDLFCAMQGKWDRRSDVSQCRPEHQHGRYLDSLVETAAEFYEPFAPNWLLLAPGNHEGSILKHHETCLSTRLAERFRSSGSPVVKGTYAGFIRFVAVMPGGKTISRVMYYTHGNGGGGPMTHGVLNTRRRQSYLPDSDIVWSGHTHDSWSVRLSKAGLTPHGRVRLDSVHHVSTPGYKDEFSPLEGWHIERGAPPKPTGAAWLRFKIDQKTERNSRRLDIDITEAK
jgi:hypothetical protein